MLSKVVSPEELIKESESLANRIIKNGPLAVRLALEAVYRGMEVTLDEGQAIESNLAGFACHSEDAHEGVTAFFEKRKPVFKGR
jgi:enoyl-CoA hydratase